MEKYAKLFTLFDFSNPDGAFLKHFQNDNKLIFNHLNYNWHFILAYLGDWPLKLKNMIKADTFLW
jgi:hypothetical protein